MSKSGFNKPPCGKVEMLIMEYLAAHKNSLIQPIQTGINKHYKVVHESIKRVVEKGLIEIGPLVKSNPSYKLSSNGVAFILAYSSDEKIIKQVIRNYEEFMEKNVNKSYLET